MPRLLIIVPTRNRAPLAANAIRSIVESRALNVKVLVSDNSTKTDHNEQLATFIEELGDARVELRKPPANMSMSAHWDWALSTALEDSTVSHLSILTDRMMFKSGGLDALIEMMDKAPDQLISYDHDRVIDHRDPIVVELSPWSDGAVQVHSSQLLALSANCTFPSALPRLLNSVVPRTILDRIRKRYGTIVSSMSPDYSFCFRALALLNTITYWDRAPILHYALGQSNGESVARGMMTDAAVDYLTPINGTVFDRAPCPGVSTVRNAMLHEFCIARDENRTRAFPVIDLSIYTAMLRREIAEMDNPETAITMGKRLDAWFASRAEDVNPERQDAPAGGILRRVLRKLGVGRLLLAMRQRLKKTPPPIPLTTKTQFADVESALVFARNTNGVLGSVKRLSFLRG